MANEETPALAALVMDRASPLGNSDGGDGRRALHVKSFTVGTPIKREWDSFTVAYPDAVTEVYSFKASTELVATVTIVYTDSTKDFIDSGTVVNL